MNFSGDVFGNSASFTASNDAMDHAKSIMACRFGWNAGPKIGLQAPLNAGSAPLATPLTTSAEGYRASRFAPCRGRLYHLLSCSHRIRTDLVEDCGINCLDPVKTPSNIPMYCHECVQIEAIQIWSQRESQHNSTYPAIECMSTELYEQWYNEHRQLEAQFFKERKLYECELRANSRPSNVCSTVAATKEEMEIAAELDSLSLVINQSSKGATTQPQPRTSRTSLPNDASEQLHWGLNTLSLGRGACGVEYSANSPVINPSMSYVIDEDELWRNPRAHN